MNKNRTVLILGAVFAVIAIVLGIMFFTQKKELNEIVDSLTEEKTLLITEYKTLVTEYDSIQTDNDSIYLRLEIEQQKVVQLIEELQTVKATNAARIREYKKELSTLRGVMRHYVVHIDSLNRVNAALVEENQVVRERFREVTHELTKLEQVKEGLTEQVAIAAQLEAKGIEVSLLTDKGRKARRLSKTAKIQFDFRIGKNVTAPVGEKQIFARITGPNGDVIIKQDSKTFKHEDKELPYSIMRIVEYGGEELPVSLFWTVEEFLFEGNYKIDLFADGAHIGEQVFELE